MAEQVDCVVVGAGVLAVGNLVARTRERRPDLLARRGVLSKEESRLLEAFRQARRKPA